MLHCARRACGGGAGWGSGSRRCLSSSKPPAGAEGGGGEGGGNGDGASVDVERRSTLRGLRQTGKDLGARLSSQLQSARGALWEESKGTRARKYLSQPEAGGGEKGAQQGGGTAGARGGGGAAAAADSVERLVSGAMERLPTLPDRGELDRKQRAELAARPQARLRDLPLREHLRVWRMTLAQYSTSLRPPPDPQPPAQGGGGVAPGAGDDGVFTPEERAAMEKDLGELRGIAADGAASARVMLQQSPQLRALAEEKMSVVRDAMACFVEGYRDAKHEAVTGQGEQAQAVEALLRDVGIERPPEEDGADAVRDQHAARRPEEEPAPPPPPPPPPQKQHGSAGGDEAAGQQQQQQQQQAQESGGEKEDKEDPGSGSQQRK